MTEYLNHETPVTRYQELARSSEADVIITGHTHIPSVFETADVSFINCGSVGRSEDGDPRACYALITSNPFSISHIRVTYDIPRAVTRFRERHLPLAFEWMTIHGHPLIAAPDLE